jgi:tetratricopeptide (TPR) repeat protein
MPAVRPGSPPGASGAPPSVDPFDPPTIRYSGTQPAEALPPRDRVLDEQGELQRGLALLSSKEWTAARIAFHALAAKVPQSKQYRSLLCYARGRETASTGRIDDAVLEFQRALQLDPDLEIARQALRELGRKSRF